MHGGTGGHITPGIAIATALKKEGHEVIFIGTENGMEKDLVPKAGFEIRYIHASGIASGIKSKIIAIQNLRSGIKECEEIIKNEKPDMCIGTGGYVTAPLIISAKKLKIHTLIHESNALPGKTTRLLARKIDEVCVGFKETKERLKRGNIVITGNPNKMGLNNLSKEEAKSKIGVEGKLLLIFGGSQGAYKINETILSIINSGEFGDYTVIYATGPKHFDEVASRTESFDTSLYHIDIKDDEITLYRKFQEEGTSLTFVKEQDGVSKDVQTVDPISYSLDNPIIIKRFIYNMEEVMKGADLVICRSGALTCTEITEVGVPAILIPFPYAAENHQYYNACTIQDAKAGVIIEEKYLTAKILLDAINEIINDDKMIEKMSANSKKLKIEKPIERITNEIMKILQ